MNRQVAKDAKPVYEKLGELGGLAVKELLR
jgi:hypothetical protein